MKTAESKLHLFLEFLEKVREKAKRLLVVVSIVLILLGLTFAAIFRPFLEGVSPVMRQSWAGLFLLTLLLTIISTPRWQCLMGVAAMLFTLALWISV